jgi:hypothetical protein
MTLWSIIAEREGTLFRGIDKKTAPFFGAVGYFSNIFGQIKAIRHPDSSIRPFSFCPGNSSFVL